MFSLDKVECVCKGMNDGCAFSEFKLDNLNDSFCLKTDPVKLKLCYNTWQILGLEQNGPFLEVYV